MSACPEETYVDKEDTTEKVVDKVALDVVDIVYLSAVCVAVCLQYTHRLAQLVFMGCTHRVNGQ